jgi:NADH-quinone oxidoreductase subunit J
LNRRAAGIAVAIFFLAILYQVLQISGSTTYVNQSITDIASQLFSIYLIPFELISLILVGGIVGMLYVAGRED